MRVQAKRHSIKSTIAGMGIMNEEVNKVILETIVVVGFANFAKGSS